MTLGRASKKMSSHGAVTLGRAKKNHPNSSGCQHSFSYGWCTRPYFSRPSIKEKWQSGYARPQIIYKGIGNQPRLCQLTNTLLIVKGITNFHYTQCVMDSRRLKLWHRVFLATYCFVPHHIQQVTLHK